MPFPIPHQTVETLKNIGMLLPFNPNMIPNPNQVQSLQSALLEDAQSNPPLNKWLETYKDDPAGYAIDEDHACLAYPFLFLLEVLNGFKQKQISPNIQNNLNFIKNLLKEKDKNLEAVLRIIRDCCT
jgi:hypothetical protein